MISSRQNRTHSTERFSFVHCQKHSDVFRTRQKKQRELQQLVQNTILSIKCSFRLVRVLESDSALHQRTRSRPPLAGEQPRQYFLSDYLLHRSASGGILPVNWRDSFLSDVDGFEFIRFFLLATKNRIQGRVTDRIDYRGDFLLFTESSGKVKIFTCNLKRL